MHTKGFRYKKCTHLTVGASNVYLNPRYSIIFGLGYTLCTQSYVDYTCSHVTLSGLYQRLFTNSYVVLLKVRNYLKAKNLWMDSPNPQLCDWLAPWYCPMPLASEGILYNIITKLMIALG